MKKSKNDNGTASGTKVKKYDRLALAKELRDEYKENPNSVIVTELIDKIMKDIVEDGIEGPLLGMIVMACKSKSKALDDEYSLLGCIFETMFNSEVDKKLNTLFGNNPNCEIIKIQLR